LCVACYIICRTVFLAAIQWYWRRRRIARKRARAAEDSATHLSVQDGANQDEELSQQTIQSGEHAKSDHAV
jgi:hypothetical protein